MTRQREIYVSVEESPTTHEAPNPAYEDLVRLKNAVLAARSTLGTALQAAAIQMSGGSAWTGPTTAKAFTQDVSGRSQRLPGLVDQILDAVDERMRSVDKTIQVADGGRVRAE